MPTYRVTAPDGQSYTVTPPEGTNPSEAEILAQIRAQVGEVGGVGEPVAPGLAELRADNEQQPTTAERVERR